MISINDIPRPENVTDQMLFAALTVATQHRREFGKGGVTLITTESVKTCFPKESILPRAAVEKLESEIQNGDESTLWFANIDANQQVHIFIVKADGVVVDNES